ncbi:MAG: hypothetical protein VX640_08820 [Pseudomonadota bacterium]|nr:hypothetical protein [Pseudomonadota bacterium]
MSFDNRYLSETSFIGAALIIMAALASLLAIVSFFFTDKFATLSFAAGGGWTISIALLVSNARQRERIKILETEILEAKRQATEWADSTKTMAKAMVGVVTLAGGSAPVPPKRKAPPDTEPVGDEDAV